MAVLCVRQQTCEVLAQVETLPVGESEVNHGLRVASVLLCSFTYQVLALLGVFRNWKKTKTYGLPSVERENSSVEPILSLQELFRFTQTSGT